tara:strand:- start:93 stop:218 length:126 start_codon:yes stop_codon:yes gene_type:complete
MVKMDIITFLEQDVQRLLGVMKGYDHYFQKKLRLKPKKLEP